jgi:hypothetical protein
VKRGEPSFHKHQTSVVDSGFAGKSPRGMTLDSGHQCARPTPIATMQRRKIRAGHPRTVDRTQKRRAVLANRASGFPPMRRRASSSHIPDSSCLRRTIAAALREKFNLNITRSETSPERSGNITAGVSRHACQGGRFQTNNSKSRRAKAYGDNDHRLPNAGSEQRLVIIRLIALPGSCMRVFVLSLSPSNLYCRRPGEWLRKAVR